MPSPHGYGHSAQVECRSVVDDGPHVLGVFGAEPTSLLLWHFSRVERLWFVYRNGWGVQWGGYQQCHCSGNTCTPNQSFSDPKALCHDNSLAVMSTVAIECVLMVVD